MAAVHPFEAIQYHAGAGDVSHFVAPPYDVLDAKSKAALLARHERNIVAVDLPHTPAKELGPPETYQAAADAMALWLREGTLKRRPAPALFAYRQTFQFEGQTRQRSGMACTIDLLPFGPRAGGGVLPHEETFSGPKEDRMALMKATKAQLSPIFGLHQDQSAAAANLVRSLMSTSPTMTAEMHDAVRHEVWTVDNPATIAAYQAALKDEDIFIADGHHRYTTALNYLAARTAQHPLPPHHPARRCMAVLVSMSDTGLVIGPTHRVLGGMSAYSLDAFLTAGRSALRFEAVAGDLHALHHALLAVKAIGEPRVGLYDFATKRGFIAISAQGASVLADRFPDKPRAWRTLDVAFTQYAIVEELCQAKLNAGQPVKWAFPHSIDEVQEIARGGETGSGGGKGFTPQLAVIVRPTPLEAVREVSRANVLMPQKSTFFYPKLATGLFVHSVE